MKKSPQTVPLAFIDRTGYVTPFNGRIDSTLDGWYIYDEDKLNKAIAQQRKLEERRITTDRGVITVDYAIDGADAARESGQSVEESANPQWAEELFGVDEAVPYLQLANKNVEVHGITATVVTADNMHQPQDNVNLTAEEIEQLQGGARTPAEMVAQVLG